MPYVEVSEKIMGVEAKAVYEVIKNMERYPLFMPDLVSVKILSKENNSTITAWKSSVNGMEFTWVEKDYFDDQKMIIDYEQIEGDLKKFAGKWQVVEEDSVVVVLGVDFELGVPVLAEMINPLLKKTICDNCVKMIVGIKKELAKAID